MEEEMKLMVAVVVVVVVDCLRETLLLNRVLESLLLL